MVTPDEIQKYSKRMREILALTGSPIGVRLQKTPVAVTGAEPAQGHRYCQALMRARHGDHVIVDASTISCPDRPVFVTSTWSCTLPPERASRGAASRGSPWLKVV